jgi:hypothetical protein
MNRISKYVASIAMLTGSVLANAGTETLDYQGNLMTGSQTGWNGENPVTIPATGTYTAFIDISGDSSSGWSLGAWAIDLDGTQALAGIGFGNTSTGQVPFPEISLEEASGTVVGASINWSYMSQGPGATVETISVGGNSGDSFSQFGDCDYYALSGGGRCGLTLSNFAPGTWTVASTATAAPEIDPATTGSALTLLAGFAAIARSRRRVAA